MKILVVDDSVIYRSQIKAALSGNDFITQLETANNGQIALDRLKGKKFDIVILDLEMPVLDGIGTLKEIKKRKLDVKVIVFSSQSKAGSQLTLQALREGAHDFIPKPQGAGINISNAAEGIRDSLLPKILQFQRDVDRKAAFSAGNTAAKTASDYAPRPAAALSGKFIKKDLVTFRPRVVVVASSTGGPTALDKAFANLGSQATVPILIVQHMPPVFTTALAKRLQEVSGIPCTEPTHNCLLENKIYVAPGDYHMTLVKLNDEVRIRLNQGPVRNYVRPAADFLFESAAEIYGPSTLGMVFTGMGEDGRAGCVRLKEVGAGIVIQDEPSCVVYGMPGAVRDEGAFDKVFNLHESNLLLKKRCE